ncbi:MAG TPA: hypothetical protein VG267_02570 [Terracidiphilus sp.]|jgi:hypothetical protein|nr:hypothetical protein [Terracidiphilus sp.]
MNCKLDTAMPNTPKLDPAFVRLAKPSQRALMGAAIFTPKDLAKHTRVEVASLHGIGPSAFPILESALREAGLTFKAKLTAEG